MKRLIPLLISISLLVILTACGSGNKETSGKGEIKKVEISLGHINPETEEAQFHKGVQKFIELVEEKTDGNVVFNVHPNGELGGEREMIEATQLGTLDMVVTSTGPLGNFSKKSLALDFPFLFKDREQAYKVLDGEIGDEINEQIEDNGMYNLAWWETGFRQLSNNKRAIKSPEDLKGLKIRTMENAVHLDAFKAMGASPTPMSFTELYTGLEQGVVDGQENPLTVIVPNKLQEVQEYLTISNHVYSPGAILINQAKFDEFPAELQEIIKKAAIEARDYERKFVADLEEEMIQVVKDSGTEVTTDYDYDAFFESTKEVYKKYDAEFGDVLNKILEME